MKITFTLLNVWPHMGHVGGILTILCQSQAAQRKVSKGTNSIISMLPPAQRGRCNGPYRVALCGFAVISLALRVAVVAGLAQRQQPSILPPLKVLSLKALGGVISNCLGLAGGFKSLVPEGALAVWVGALNHNTVLVVGVGAAAGAWLLAAFSGLCDLLE